MRKLLIAMLCVLAISGNAQTSVTINTNSRLQTVEGWGVSLCWWAAQAGQWDDESIAQIADWLVSPNGLNYNVFRYNIPGGDDPEHKNCTVNHMKNPKNGKGLRADMAGFIKDKHNPGDWKNWHYDWDADIAQIKMLRAIVARAKHHGKEDILKIEAFSNSCPWWMTVSGCVSGAANPSDTNLKKEYFEDFARYLIDVCKHFKEEEGIEFYTLEPFNEPYTDYWNKGGGQEGCGFLPGDQINFVKNYLAPVLEQSTLKTVISVSDETNLKRSAEVLDAYSNDATVMSKITQWNTHTYDGSNSERTTLLTKAKTVGKRLWMSETGDMGSKATVWSLCQKLFNDMRYLQPVVWCDWQVMEPNPLWSTIECGGSNDVFDSNNYWRNLNYYVRKQVTSNIKVGYTILDTGKDNVLAAVSPEGDELVVCFLNTNTSNFFSDGSVKFKLIVSSDFELVNATITDADRNCTDFAISNLDNFSVPKQSVVTVVLSGDFSMKLTDTNGNLVESGEKYLLSGVKVNKNVSTDYYFWGKNDETVSSSASVSTSDGFVKAEYVWEPTKVGTKFILQNKLSDKYLAGLQPDLSVDNPKDAMRFFPIGPNTKGNTSNHWALEVETYYANRYLNWDGGTEGKGLCYWKDGASDNNSNFRFHRLEYIHINAFVQKNGMLEPVEFRINNNNALIYTGEAELYCNQSISGKVLSFALTSPINAISKRYILNGEPVSANYDVKNLKDGDWLTVIYIVNDLSSSDEFYKIKKNGKFITVGESLALSGDSDDAIFYHSASSEGSTLLSYTKGFYVKDNTLSTMDDNSGSQILFVKENANDGEDGIKLSAILSDNKYLNCDYEGGIAVSAKTDGAYSLTPVEALPVCLKDVDGKGYSTFYSPVPVSVPDGLEAYTGKVNGSSLHLTAVKDKVIPAGTAVILYTEGKEMNYSLQIVESSVSDESELEGTFPRKYVVGNIYGLNKKNGKVGFYKMREGSVLSPFRAFLDLGNNDESKEFSFDFSETDIVEAIEMWHQDNTIYDLQGRKVQNPGTGIYIVNGKKILITK